jgi:UDP-N-acetyl-D-galactosamine dehydrogenase
LAQKLQEAGYHPEIILAGLRMNDRMGAYVASEVVKLYIKKDVKVKNVNVLVLGITFKENCPDVRNTKVGDVVPELAQDGINSAIYDLWANPDEVQREYNLETFQKMPHNKFDGIVLAVAPKAYLDIDFTNYLTPNGAVYDVKGVLRGLVDGKL